METRQDPKLKTKAATIYIKDIYNISENDKAHLIKLLHEKSQSESPYVLLETEEMTSLTPEVASIKRVYELVGRPSSVNPAHYHFDRYLRQDALAEGQFSEINPIIDTLTISKNDEAFLDWRNKKNRIGKWMEHKKGAIGLFRHEVSHEFNLTKRNIQIGAKTPVFIKTSEDKTFGVMTLNYLPDVDLTHYLPYFDSSKNPIFVTLTEFERLQLITAALLSQQVVEQNRVVHRDIKAFNVRVKTDSYQATVIDFGLSRSGERDDGKFPGTPLYSPPEFFQNWWEEENPIRYPLTTASDVFNWLWAISGLLNADAPTSTKRLEAIKVAHQVMEIINQTLFRGLTFTPEEMESMRAILTKMGNENPEARPSSTAVLDVFEPILLTYLLEKYEMPIRDDIVTVFKVGIMVRKSLYQLATNFFSEDLEGLTKIKSVLDNLRMLNTVPDLDKLLPIFFARINSPFLSDSLSKESVSHVLSKIDLLVKDYQNHFKEAAMLATQVSILKGKATEKENLTEEEKAAISSLTNIIHQLFQLHPKNTYALTLDNIQYFNKRYQKHLPRLERQFQAAKETLKEIIEKNTSASKGPLSLPSVPLVRSGLLPNKPSPLHYAQGNNTIFNEQQLPKRKRKADALQKAPQMLSKSMGGPGQGW